ncbi:hypothetical protein Tco_0058981 [Tanacetum coccineum]
MVTNSTPPPVTDSRYEKVNNLGSIKNLIPITPPHASPTRPLLSCLHPHPLSPQAHKQLLAQSTQSCNGSSAHQQSNSNQQPIRGIIGPTGSGTSVGQQVHAHVAQFGNSGYDSGHTGDWNSTQETNLP